MVRRVAHPTPNTQHPMTISLIDTLESITEEALQHHLLALPQWRREQALRYKFIGGKRECTIAYRLLQKNLLQDHGITEPPHFTLTEHGKPLLQEYPSIHFNLSHCRQAAICVTHDAPVGVDIECERTITPSLLRYTMNDSEVAQVEQAADPTLQFLRLWTQKEAVFKLTGTGITSDVKDILTEENLRGIHLETYHPDGKEYVYSIATYQDHSE